MNIWLFARLPPTIARPSTSTTRFDTPSTFTRAAADEPLRAPSMIGTFRSSVKDAYGAHLPLSRLKSR
ncbi:uncharacterized protein PHACADRAFT_246045 [Phanerochaete carnosa HHB-10118-sp]|uniref:Uncharacterized protein n=1 Tax=Phanerochaete carnosa (strain HHB-10118-sp) TaxID=650164 RepID=K5WLY0_PHACS|nr:uncharacterized protein PHACADRAFT_246045 [Phanerochaete carnosa HHB-10118-sp]EKM60194.1 hypothetical protein PHACADRAFT_246045 [Phanerochaete carnosa HHB-10118-sp]